jgi:hypothetical protein
LKIRQLDSFLPANGWALLVLAGEKPSPSELASALEGRRILAISLPELLAQMGREAFADVVRQLRNQRVHS